MSPAEWEAFANVLEGRRSSASHDMWQAPALTIAAQAFLLNVLTDPALSVATLTTILVAGVAACAAAILTLARLRAREIRYSEAVSFACEEAGLLDPRPSELDDFRKTAHTQPGPGDRLFRALGEWKRLPTVYLFWILALALFIVADVVAYACNV